MSTLDPLTCLLTTPRRRESLLHVADLPPVTGEHADWPDWADARLVAAYRARGVERPWAHQVEAANHIHAQRHTVIATATGSGKSLAIWLPTLTRILGHDRSAPTSLAALQRRPTALYLSPTKALAADQLAALGELLAAAPGAPGDRGLTRALHVTTCDGDTPREERDWARNHADVVLTNPDFLHFALLPGHERWTRLLRSLSVVVLDEAHAYRGVFGAHVALVLRRLLRLARDLGADPVVAAASATAGEPDLTLARLIGVGREAVAPVTRSTARQGRRRIALWEPAPLDSFEEADDEGLIDDDGERPWASPAPLEDLSGVPDDVPRRSAQAEVIDLLADLTRARVRTLAFVRSRAGVEAVAAATNERLAGGSRPVAEAEDPVRILEAGGRVPVAAYRGGYLPEERRTLEAALRDGRLGALATTNALELGIDVSGLDAVLLAGWPGTRVSFWQQAGRAGRAGSEGLAILVAGANPLDTYLAHHPEEILGQGVEVTTFDPSNPYVLGPHLCAAAAERPLTEADLPLFGLPDAGMLDALAARGLLRRLPGRLVLEPRPSRAAHRPRRPARHRRSRRPGGRGRERLRARHGRRGVGRRHGSPRRRVRAPGAQLRRRLTRGGRGDGPPSRRGPPERRRRWPRARTHTRRPGRARAPRGRRVPHERPLAPAGRAARGAAAGAVGTGHLGVRAGRGDQPGHVVRHPPAAALRGGRERRARPARAPAAHHGRVVVGGGRGAGRRARPCAG
ncbi:DEAD/DEAH box helicase [Salana multivorans]